MMSNHLADVIFDQKENAYFSGNQQYRRVSNVLSMLKVPFDREGVSRSMALSEAKFSHKSVAEIQSELLDKWDGLRDDAIDHGNELHNACEDYFRYGKINPKYPKMIRTISELMSEYHKPEPEKVIFLHKAKMAGTTDLRCKRTRNKNSLVDYFDYKTNQRNGIRFDSAKRDNGKLVKHYNKMMLHPVSHLEDCNYNHYSLQLSLYAYMDEMEVGLKPGRLAIIFLYPSQRVTYFPVPYMRYEAEAIVNHVINLKQIPA